MAEDWYPASMDARATWHANWGVQLPLFAVKYGIPAAILTQVGVDNTWMQYWVQARHEADNISQQLTKFFNEIAGNAIGIPAPAPINFALTGTPPTPPPPGIEFRTRSIARDIKGSMSYSQADGEALGIVTPESTPPDTSTISPVFTTQTLVNYEIRVTFRKKGMDAVKFEVKQGTAAWKLGGFLLTSPGVFTVIPTTAGSAEQVQIRAVYLLKNEEVGVPSASQTVTIAP